MRFSTLLEAGPRQAGPLHAARLFAALLFMMLAGCSGGVQEAFAPACPSAAIIRDAADLSRYRGTAHDLVDNVLSARITGINGDCKRDGTDTVVTTVRVGIDLTRGPAAPGREARVAYFVAVLDGDLILDKQVFPLRAEFPANADRLRLAGDDVELRLKVRPDKTAAAYRIQVGFQLTPEELEANRQREQR
jgi:hypothetical protein